MILIIEIQCIHLSSYRCNKKKNMQKLGETMTLSTRITKNILAEKAKLFLR